MSLAIDWIALPLWGGGTHALFVALGTGGTLAALALEALALRRQRRTLLTALADQEHPR